MRYFITGATGFIGRHLVAELIKRDETEIYALHRESSAQAMQLLIESLSADLPATSKIVPVVGDLTLPRLGLHPNWISEHAGSIDHFFHLGAHHDLAAGSEILQATNVAGTKTALAVAERLRIRNFHHMSSIAVAGDFTGVFDETMFDEGQALPSLYHVSKYDAEALVRSHESLRRRIYRPSIVVGHSETGVMDKSNGPYYFFPALKRLRDTLPEWTPLVGLDFGDTNLVPVDYVVRAMDHLAHKDADDCEVFHLASPQPQPLVEVANVFADAARAPKFAVPVDRRVAARLPTGALGSGMRPTALLNKLLRQPAASLALGQSIGRLGVPAQILTNAVLSPVIATRHTQRALTGSGLEVPLLSDYAETLWTYWEEVLDDAVRHDKQALRALRGKTVIITGASSGIGFATAAQIAKCGAKVVLIARSADKLKELRDTIRRSGGEAVTYVCDLSDLDAIDQLIPRLLDDLPQIDFLVNNAGRSIRRSIELSGDRFHDFERTMQLNYFGTIRLVMGLLPRMRAQGGGHVVNVSSVGVLAKPPRFSAYIASKAALDAWTDITASEAIRDKITFTTINMPLVRTPMISPTKAYRAFSTISPGQAAAKVIQGLVHRPREINTMTGQAMALVHQMVPTGSLRLLNLAYQSMPEQGMRASDHSERTQKIVRAVYQKLRW